MRTVLALGVLLAASAHAAASAGGARAACPTERSEDALAASTPEGEVRLASGAVVTLAGLRIPDEPALRAQAAAFLARHHGRSVALTAGEADRWGRRPARLVVAQGEGRLDLSHGLVEEGLALVDAGEADALCAVELLALEATARGRGLGLWADGRYKPVAAEDLARLRALAGAFALVEGRVRSVGERRQRTYLNFGADWASDFTITIPKRSWAILQERGVSAAGLRGRRVRARGVIEDRRGPALEIVAPEMLEVLDEERRRGR